MNFNTLGYLLFLPTVTIIHWLLPHKARGLWLLSASWFFYFCWDPLAGLLLLATTFVTWLCALHLHKSSQKHSRQITLAIALTATLGVLGLFKYAGFFASIFGLSFPLRLILPVGISFYTFQTLSYVLDVYRGDLPAEESFLTYALFVAFFPQLVAGPIERPQNLMPQLRAERRWNPANLPASLLLILTGYIKKVVIADSLAALIDPIYAAPNMATGPQIVLATVLFGLQIYCDFSGYSDIARGSARLLDIQLMENFRHPYLAVSIRDFWRRWHISLTAWLRDYLYIPLGGSRKGLPRRLLNLLIVFFISGLWHGAHWNFVVWGLIHGIYQICEVLIESARKPSSLRSPFKTTLSRTITFLLVTFAWLFFRVNTLSDAWTMLLRIPQGWNQLPFTAPALLRAFLLVLCLPMVDRLPDRWKMLQPSSRVLLTFSLLLVLAICWLSQLSTGAPNAFIYFQF